MKHHTLGNLNPEPGAPIRVNGADQAADVAKTVLPSTSMARKTLPIATGVLDYFPAALAEVAKLSKLGNDKHNPGQPLHHARGKSTDHADCILRHLIERGEVDRDTGLSHTVAVAWRALAMLQEECEARGAPLARGARLPEPEPELLGGCGDPTCRGCYPVPR